MATLTFKNLSKNGKRAIFSGGIHIPVSRIEGDPAQAEVTGPFKLAAAKEPKVKETKEERKARLAALPKPTEAERIAQAEARLQKRKDKLAKQSAAASEAPVSM